MLHSPALSISCWAAIIVLYVFLGLLLVCFLCIPHRAIYQIKTKLCSETFSALFIGPYPATLKSMSLFLCLFALDNGFFAGLFFQELWHLQGVLCKPKNIYRCPTFPCHISGLPAFLAGKSAEGGIIRAKILLINPFFFFSLKANLGNKHRQKRSCIPKQRCQNKKEYFSEKFMQGSPRNNN